MLKEPLQKKRIWNSVNVFRQNGEKRVAIAHSEGVQLYDGDGKIVTEYFIGNCYATAFYKEEVYTLCNNTVINLCQNRVVIKKTENSLKFVDLEFVNEALYLCDGTYITAYDSVTFTKKREFCASTSAISGIYKELFFIDKKSGVLQMLTGKSEVIVVTKGLECAEDLCIGQYGDGCGGGRIFIADTCNKKVKVYDRDANTIITLLECENTPYCISKLGCELYIMLKHSIISFNIATMKTNYFLKED